MGWIGKTLIGTVAVLGIGYASLAYITREPDRPVVALPVSGKLLLSGVIPVWLIRITSPISVVAQPPIARQSGGMRGLNAISVCLSII